MTIRTFELVRERDVTGVSGTGVVADGVLWPDGHASLRWRGDRRSTSSWDSLDDLEAVHGHEGATRVVWTDEPTLAGDILIDDAARELYIDGRRFPWKVAAAGPRIVFDRPDTVDDRPVVWVPIMTDVAQRTRDAEEDGPSCAHGYGMRDSCPGCDADADRRVEGAAPTWGAHSFAIQAPPPQTELGRVLASIAKTTPADFAGDALDMHERQDELVGLAAAVDPVALAAAKIGEIAELVGELLDERADLVRDELDAEGADRG
ncbi:hypothetical protein ACWESM_18665 [Nocardia sp. NPDC003999]